MMLPEGMHSIPAGHLAAVVTYLQMTAPAMTDPKPFPEGITGTHGTLDIVSYRALYRAVGAPWLWTSRLEMKDDALADILGDDAIEQWVIRQGNKAIGLVELDFRKPNECELAYFGILKDATGQGLGGPMMALAQSCAFGREIGRFFVHTCHLDDPRALAFYQKAGFVPYQTAVEVFADPRLSGTHPTSAGSHIPCLP